MAERELTLGSLFSGSGGFELAGALCGIKPVFCSEIEPFPIRVEAARFPDCKQLGDVTKINGAEIEPVDIITFGSPCQDLSVAGKQAGLAGERSGLYLEAVRIIREMKDATNGQKPLFCVFENVPGLLSSNNGNDFITALDLLQDVGYIPDPNFLDAQNMGVPQRRKRVYIAWLNVDYITRKRTHLSEIITLQLLTELLQIYLVGLLKALGSAQKELGALPKRLSEDGARKRIALFSLQREESLQTLRQNLDAIQAIYQKERENWDFSLGDGQMVQLTLMDMVTPSTTLNLDLPDGYIASLLSKTLEDLCAPARSSTTSTSTKQTIESKICTCFQALANMSNVIGVYCCWLEKTHPEQLNYCEWVKSFLTEMKVCINAARKHEKSVGWMEWDDNIGLCERTINAIEKHFERHTRTECRHQVLPVRKGMRGYPAPCREAWEGTPSDAEGSAGGSGGAWCLKGNFIDRNTHQNGIGWNYENAYTLDSTDRHGVSIPNRGGSGI